MKILFALFLLATPSFGKGLEPLPKILCTLYGSYLKVDEPAKLVPESVVEPEATVSPSATPPPKSKVVRRRFLVKTFDECKKEVEDHCKFAEKPLGYKPGKLSGYFREGPKEPETRFIVDKNCGVYRDGKK